MMKGGYLLKSSNRLLKIRSGPLVMRIVSAVSLFLSLLLSLPAVSPAAASISGDSNTYLQSRETENNKKILGAYEYLNFSAQDAGKETISFHFGGWLRYDLGDAQPFGSRTDNDLQYGYLSFRGRANSLVNVGRVMVFEGVAAERVDGIYARTDLVNNFGVSAFGGRPVETPLATFHGNQSIYGARVSHQVPGLYRIGISALKEEHDSNDFREEVGIDLWVKPINKVELMGNSKYNSLTSDWANHSYFLVLGPFDKVRLNTEASWINYKDYFSAATTTAFSFQPAVLDPSEKVRILGEELLYGFTDKLTMSANLKAYTYSIAGHATYAGINVRYSDAKYGGAGLSVHKMYGDEDRLRYMEYRVYGYRKLDKLDVTLDVLDVAYTTAINNVKNAYSASLAAAYELTEKLKLGADVEYSKNPDFNKDIRTFVKLTYSFDTAYVAHKPAAEPVSPVPYPAPVPAPVTTAPAPPPEQSSPAVAPSEPAPAPEQGAPVVAPEQGKPKEGNE
jgi:hypothetical protein